MSPWERAWAPLPRWNAKSQTSPQIVGTKDPLGHEKRHRRDRENLNKAISFDQKGASMYSLQLSGHVSTK
jgi:hypothetical protein